jgi:hypothetical protein
MTDSQKDLAAIVEEAAEEGTSRSIMLARRYDREEESERRHTGLTPPPVSAAESTDRMIRGISKEVFDAEIKGHKLGCMEPGGGLCEVGKKVDKILEVMSEARGEKRVMALGRAALGAAALAVLGFTLNHFAARRSEDATAKQEAIANVVAKKLQKVEEAAKAMTAPDLFTPAKVGK